MTRTSATFLVELPNLLKEISRSAKRAARSYSPKGRISGRRKENIANISTDNQDSSI